MNLKLRAPETKKPQDRLYQLQVPLIGLTGGIATGKSTVASMLRKRGYEIIDADALVKRAYTMSTVKEKISALCPEAVVLGEIDFKILRERVFSNPKLKENVEAIIYAELPILFLSEVKPEQNFIIYDVPLLFEKGLNLKSDYSVVVYCPANIQRARLLERDRLDPEIADKILASQWPIDRKRESADFVVDNSLGLEQLERNVEDLLEKLFERVS